MSIIINSDKRTDQSVSPTEFKLQYQYPLEKGDYTLKYVYMPFTISTINKNNQSFLLNGSLISLPIGDYLTVESLRIVLETTLQSVDVNFTVTVIGNVLTITNTSNFTLDFTDYDIARVLGFQKRSYAPTLSQEGSGIVNLNPLTSINILVNNRCDIRDNGSLAYTFRIPVIANKNSFITYEPNMWLQTVNFTSDQHLLTIRVCDDSFRTVDTQGVNWWMVLKRSE